MEVCIEYKFSYIDYQDKIEIINNNENLFLISDFHNLDEKYIIMSDEKPKVKFTWEEEVENKISILEAENETLQRRYRLNINNRRKRGLSKISSFLL